MITEWRVLVLLVTMRRAAPDFYLDMAVAVLLVVVSLNLILAEQARQGQQGNEHCAA